MTKINLAKEREYAKIAAEFLRIKRKGLAPGENVILPTIRPHTDQWLIWRTFFASYFGFVPYAMQRAEDGMGSGQFTVPCESPDQLAAGYYTPDYLPPLPPDDPSGHLSLPERRAIVQRIQGEIRAAKPIEPPTPKPKAFSLYSEDELRRLYPQPTPKDSSNDPPL